MTFVPVRDARPVSAYPIRFTWREIDVLAELLKDGADNETIARRLNLSLDTVKSHMRNLMSKASVSSRTALVVAVGVRREVVVFTPNSRAVDF